MKMKLIYLLMHSLFKSSVPLLVGASYHLFKEVFSIRSVTTSKLTFDGFQQKFNGSQTSPEEIAPGDSLSKLNQISFGIYSNFFSFMLVMLLLDVLFHLIKLGAKNFWKEAKSSRVSLDDDSSIYSSQRKGAVYQISENQIMRIFSYALIFISLQITGLGLSLAQSQTLIPLHHEPMAALESPQDPEKNFPLMMMNDDQENDFGIPRSLEEASDNELLVSALSSPAVISDKISLSMGNVLSSLNLNANAFVLSKDRKIAYVTLDIYGTLKVVDISDLQSPFVIGSLNLEGATYSYRVKNLLLSSDEKTLYASNSRDLEIIDVTDPSSPKLISLTKSEIFIERVRGYNQNSLVVQERTKTLFIGGMGLQVYDISDVKKPALLKTLKNEKHSITPLRNEICLSRDEEVLFVANGTLDIYNISNPREMKLLYSHKMESSPRSLLLSEDGRTAFLVGTASEYPWNITFQEVNISDYGSVSVLKTTSLGYHASVSSPYILAVSPSQSKFFIFAQPNSQDEDLLIFDRVKQTTIKDEKSLIKNTRAMNFSPDGRTLVTASNGQFMTLELISDYPNKRIFSESLDNLISHFSLPTSCSSMEISNDEKYLFILRREAETSMSFDLIFEIWDMKSPNGPRLLSSYRSEEHIRQMYLTKDYERVYLIDAYSITVLDIGDQSSIKLKKTKTFPEHGDNQRNLHFTTSSDEKTGFLLANTHNDGFGYLSLFDLSQATPFLLKAPVKVETEFKITYSKLIVKDDKTLIIVLQGGFLIYDISNLDSPTQIASLPFGLNEPELDSISPVLSPDQKTLYIETADKTEVHKLRIYNVSSSTSPQLVSEKDLSKRERFFKRPGFSLFPDLKSGFIAQEDSLLRLNVTNPKEITVSGIIPLSSKFSNYMISPDGQTLYISVLKEIRVINMNLKYTLFLKQDKFSLGEKYSGQISLLNLMGASDYNLLDFESYKLTKLSLLNINVVTNNISTEVKTSILPSWITFDRESDTLTVEAKKQRDIGKYTFQAAFSLKIPKNVFKDLPVSSNDLWAWLTSLGYVDNELFLTANFGSGDDFLLPDKFENHTKEIYGILKQFYFETCTGFEIASSLKFEEKKNTLAVSTLSTNNLKVEIKLEPNGISDAKFVSSSYGSLFPMLKDNTKTKIALEGTLKEINTAMNSIVVNFENGTLCDANIVINDGFNPQVSLDLVDIARFFKANKHPYVNSQAEKTIQEQIDSANIQTGTYFTFPFSEDSFGDEYAEHLDYEVIMEKNGTAFPSWLSLNGLTLKGTPPEDIVGRDIDLILIAKNEFKQYRVPFKLHIKISAVFVFKLMMKYSPYILTLVGLFVSANKIFNILKKKDYKHGKEFYVGVGEEISANMIFPISFIKEENKQSQLILKELLRAKGDFIDPSQRIIDKEKVISAIKEAIQKMPVQTKRQMTLYPSPTIDQIIINKLTWIQLDLKEEIKTKQLFKELEPYCLEVIEKNTSSLGFTVDQRKFSQLMKRTKMSPGGRNSTLEDSLLIHEIDISEGVNIHLLKDAILAFAFENHSIDLTPLDIDIGIKQKVQSNALFRFLKFDLRDVHLNDKGKIDYGINYRIFNDQLLFNGIAQDYLKGKTLVVQVKNLHQRILKEIWIHGVSSDFQKDEIFMIRDEVDMRGQGYEIY